MALSDQSPTTGPVTGGPVAAIPWLRLPGKTVFLALVGAAYAASWLLPVGHYFFIGNLPGWAAFLPALYLCQYGEMTTPYDVAWLLSAWTNVIFVLSFVCLVTGARARSGLLSWALGACAAFNLLWWTGRQGAELRIGFYLWVLCFACLAAGARIYRTAGAAEAAASPARP